MLHEEALELFLCRKDIHWPLLAKPCIQRTRPYLLNEPAHSQLQETASASLPIGPSVQGPYLLAILDRRIKKIRNEASTRWLIQWVNSPPGNVIQHHSMRKGQRLGRLVSRTLLISDFEDWNTTLFSYSIIFLFFLL